MEASRSSGESANEVAVTKRILATMNPNPLTDQTSLIAYRLAHGETSRTRRRLTREPTPTRTRGAPVAIVGLGLLLATVFVLANR